MQPQAFDVEELPQVDLKGHTVEELAVAANVSVDTIKTAIKMRQQQLLLEKRNYSNQLKQKINNYVTPRTVLSTTSIRTTQLTTTTRPITTFAPKIKVHHKSSTIASSHKVKKNQPER